MKTSLFLIGLLFFCLSPLAQQLERQVIASAGNIGTDVSFTIGEVIVNSDNLLVTAGFQQPTFMEDEEPPVGLTDITGELNVYPVPTKNMVTINGTDFDGSKTHVGLYTTEGKQVEVEANHHEKELKLNLERLPSGTYYLTLRNSATQTIAKFKILKMK